MKTVKLFIPLLFLYIAIILVFSSNDFHGDETRYLKYATNLLNGYYVEKEDIVLNNGPGYPFALMPFVFAKIPIIITKISNAFFLYFADLYFFLTLRIYLKKKYAIIFTYLLGIYPPILRLLPYLLSDVFAFFLICGFIYNFCMMFNQDKFVWVKLINSSLYFAVLALTRTIFGYVIIFGLIFFICYLFIKKSKSNIKSSVMLTGALLLCVPYLYYTYSLTNKIFYWGTNAGIVLYCLTTPYPGEFGDCFLMDTILYGDYKGSNRYDSALLRKNHKKLFEEIEPLSTVQRDDKLKKKAIDNIIHYPKKCIKNYAANIGRLLFNFPYSYTPQKLDTYFYLLPNMVIIVLSMVALYASFIGRKLVPYEIKTLVVLGIIYLGGSSMVCAQSRYFTFIVPIILLWISNTYIRILKIEIRKQEDILYLVR